MSDRQTGADRRCAVLAVVWILLGGGTDEVYGSEDHPKISRDTSASEAAS